MVLSVPSYFTFAVFFLNFFETVPIFFPLILTSFVFTYLLFFKSFDIRVSDGFFFRASFAVFFFYILSFRVPVRLREGPPYSPGFS